MGNHRWLLFTVGKINKVFDKPINSADGINGIQVEYETIEKYKPDYMAVEELFFNNNAKTAIAVGQARGVILLSAVNAGVPFFEYTPLQVKQAVVGYGRADKGQVQQMVKAILSLSSVPKPDDVADALAIAVCHAHSHRMSKLETGKF
jgi:crossover junction endodeoxyribonuclease RuvC